jgi:hypothetical protein
VVKIAMVHVLGFVEDERCFNFVTFFKNKVWNRLTNHLELVVSMHAHKVFTLHNFPYEDTYEMWSNVQSTNGRGQYVQNLLVISCPSSHMLVVR